MTEESLFITNSFGEKLKALLRKPTGNGPFPAVLFVSGFGMDLHEYKNSNDEISKLLVEQGFLTLQFSFAGRGKSEGDYAKMTLERQAKQVEDMITWLNKQKNVHKNSIGIFAQSFGCPTTISTNLNRVKSICLNCGVYFLNDKFKELLRNDFAGSYINTDGNIVFINEKNDKFAITENFWKLNLRFDPLPIVQNISIPIFMTHGDKDKFIHPADAKKVFSKIWHKNKKLKIYKNGVHAISSDSPSLVRGEFLFDVVKWFKQTLK